MAKKKKNRGSYIGEIERDLSTLETELLRWNEQINLVSRRDTARTIAGLMRQCCETAASIVQMLEESQWWPAGLAYLDIGSGNGFPGLVWKLYLDRGGTPVPSALIEPRVKRAWFLERMARMLGMKELHVACRRWEDTVRAGEEERTISDNTRLVLISMKALKKSDAEVLEVIQERVRQGAAKITDLWICRFEPREVENESGGKGLLDPATTRTDDGQRMFEKRDRVRLGDRGASAVGAVLNVTRYRRI